MSGAQVGAPEEQLRHKASHDIVTSYVGLGKVTFHDQRLSFPLCVLTPHAAVPGQAEAKDNAITISDEDPATIRRLLEFLYTSEYTAGKDASLPVQHARLYVAADKYLLSRLRDQALASYIDTLEFFGVELHELIREIYQRLDEFEQLTQPLVEMLVGRLDRLMNDTGFIELLENETPELWKDLLRAYAKDKSTARDDLRLRVCNNTSFKSCSGTTHKVKVEKLITCTNCGDHKWLKAPPPRAESPKPKTVDVKPSVAAHSSTPSGFASPHTATATPRFVFGTPATLAKK